MKQNTTKLGFSILAAAFALGLAAPAFAQEDVGMRTYPEPQPWGLLGAGYGGAAFTYDHVSSSSPSEWRGFALDYNLPLQAGLDFNLLYDWQRAENYLGRLTQQDAQAGVTAFAPLSWGKPFVQGLAGWGWRKGDANRDDSFKYTLGTGVEFHVASSWVLTPYVNFQRATSFNRSEFDYGVKTAYRLNRQWSLDAGVQYEAVMHAKDGVGYTLGVNYHY